MWVLGSNSGFDVYPTISLPKEPSLLRRYILCIVSTAVWETPLHPVVAMTANQQACSFWGDTGLIDKWQPQSSFLASWNGCGQNMFVSPRGTEVGKGNFPSLHHPHVAPGAGQGLSRYLSNNVNSLPCLFFGVRGRNNIRYNGEIIFLKKRARVLQPVQQILFTK